MRMPGVFEISILAALAFAGLVYLVVLARRALRLRERELEERLAKRRSSDERR